MPDSVLIFITKYHIINNMPYIDKHIKRLLDNEERKYAFLKTLDELGRLDLVMPYIDQDIIATSRMIDWLIYPTELGTMPTDIAMAGKIEKNNLIYYAFKFKTDIERLKDREYMVGVCGGYEKGKVTTMDSGIVFSKFDKADDDIINEAEELIDEIISYWQNRQYNN